MAVTAEKLIEIRNKAQEAKDRWIAEKEGTIEKEVRDLLDKQKNRLIAQLLGFDVDHWTGQLKLDHCNGRAGNSIAGDVFRKSHQEAINKWFAELTVLPELTNKDKEAIMAEYKEALMSELKSEANRMGQQKAKDYLDQVLLEATDGEAVLVYLAQEEAVKKSAELKRLQDIADAKNAKKHAEEVKKQLEEAKVKAAEAERVRKEALAALEEEALKREKEPRVLTPEL